MSKATLRWAHRQVQRRLRAVVDPEHVRMHIEWEPRDPLVARGGEMAAAGRKGKSEDESQ